MEDIFLQALINRVQNEPKLLEHLPIEIRKLVEDKIREYGFN